jgi:RHS repeat-associated protein
VFSVAYFLEIVLGYSIIDYTHDANGNLFIDSSRNGEFCYDIFNQLDTVVFDNSPDSHYIAFGYNADGLRIRKDYHYTYWDNCDGGGVGQEMGGEGPSSDTAGEGDNIDGGGDSLCLFLGRQFKRYIREKPGGKVLAEYNDDEPRRCKFKFIYAGDQRIAMYDEFNRLHFYLNDHLGSARLVIDTIGTVIDKYSRYYAFGDAESQTVSTNQAYRYTGKPYDDDGSFDLYYYGARYYDPELGRFIAVDALSAKYTEWSPYTYSLNNPLKYFDFNGKDVAFFIDKDVGTIKYGHAFFGVGSDKEGWTLFSIDAPQKSGVLERVFGRLDTELSKIREDEYTVSEMIAKNREIVFAEFIRYDVDDAIVVKTPKEEDLKIINHLMELFNNPETRPKFNGLLSNCLKQGIDIINYVKTNFSSGISPRNVFRKNADRIRGRRTPIWNQTHLETSKRYTKSWLERNYGKAGHRTYYE